MDRLTEESLQQGKKDQPLFFYDLYRALLEEMMEVLQDPDRQRAMARAQHLDSLRELVAVDPTALYQKREIPPAMRLLYRQLCQCRPYQLNREVSNLADAMLHKAGETPLRAEPWLSVPLWFELDGIAIGSEQFQAVAFFFYRDEQQRLCCDLLQPDMQRSKRLLFAPNGDWQYEQGGPCETQECPFAAATRTTPGKDYLIAHTQKTVECRCYQEGFALAQFVKGVNYLLLYRKKPLLETTVVREVPLPHPSEGKLTRKQKEANTQARQTTRPNVRTISLSAPVSLTRPPLGSTAPAPTAPKHAEEESTPRLASEEKQHVGHYWKMLVPGEGKPWKEFQLLLVSDYERDMPPSASPMHYRVVE